MRTTGIGVVIAAALGMLLGPAAADQSVPPGTVVMLQFMEEVSTKKARVGDTVKLRVYTDVIVGGKTLIRQDATATGIVSEVRRPGRFGRRARLNLRVESVRDVNGVRVPVEPYSSGNRFSAGGPGAAAGGLIVLGPLGLVGGIFVKGNHISVKEGTKFQVQVAGAKKEKGPAKKGNVPPVEPP